MLNFAFAILTALLLILIQPAPALYWLAPFALSPLLYALACAGRPSPSPKRAFLLGYVAGVVYWAGVCYWIQFVLDVHGGMGFWGGTGTFVLFCLAKALHLAVFAWGARYLLRRPIAAPLIAAWWVVLERTHSTFGFMWLHLGNAGIDLALPMRLAPITGVYGLSFVFALLSAGVTLALLRRPRRELWPLAALLILPVLPSLPPPEPARQTAVVTQPNLDTEIAWTGAKLRATQDTLARLTLESALEPNQPTPDVLVWPEVPAPFYYDIDPTFRQTADSIARTTKIPFLLGVVSHGRGPEIFNSAQLLSTAGQPIARYDKINLVPFGEFIPPPFGFVNRITDEVGDFTPGSKIVVFPLNGHRAGTFICYESAFPHEVRQFAAEGAEVLFNQSNDGYFGRSGARQQHLSLVRMRAAENNRWILRSTNDGYTVAISPTGQITERFEPYTQRSGRLHYNYIGTQTIYTRYGDWFIWLNALALLTISAVRYAKRGTDSQSALS